MKKVALAIFVKTPELSPIKTRLARDFGRENALSFYEKALKATAEIATLAANAHTELRISPCWAVAEEKGASDRRWREFPVICQREGSLGERQHYVYEDLLLNHEGVILIGADSPQLSVETILTAAEKLLEHKKFVMGLANDGGYYLFGGSQKLPLDAWQRVTYSLDTTAKQLMEQVSLIGEIDANLPKITDGDCLSELRPLADELKKLQRPTPSQREIISFLERLKI